MAGGTNNVKKPGFPGGPGAYQPGGQNGGEWMPPQMGNQGPPQWGQGGYPGGKPGGPPPNPAQMEAWKKQFANWKPGQGQPGQFPPMNIPGLLPGGQPGQYGSNMPPGFPGYDNLPKNWQDDGYSWQDPNNPDGKYNIIA